MAHPKTFKAGSTVGWTSYLQAPAIEELSDEQRAALRPVQVRAEYYRLLARDPKIVDARTTVDNAIYHAREGLPRGERELCAAVSSMITGCPVCTTTHVKFAAKFSKREDDVLRLAEEGLESDVGYRWNSMVNAAANLAAVRPVIDQNDVDSLRGTGFSEEEILDVVHSTAFFAWANRLLMTLGETTVSDPA
ncbi:peroxidase-related enzyme [Kineosporia babensis]|uniref:Peroxidase-related enzyme n=1 Tax=Kineosporia babensis TaxID=499548 RepID=A0A9X1NHI8_9ACTN|nr:peroxidase-related enzyme [Kineosporia babensis]MCD5314100.1 peroxidase-related enzyme [Kineosporia babensis]